MALLRAAGPRCSCSGTPLKVCREPRIGVRDRRQRRPAGESMRRWLSGLAGLGDRFTGRPWAGLRMTETGCAWCLGWRLTPAGRHAPNLTLGIEAERRESVNDNEHGIMLRLDARRLTADNVDLVSRPWLLRFAPTGVRLQVPARETERVHLRTAHRTGPFVRTGACAATPALRCDGSERAHGADRSAGSAHAPCPRPRPRAMPRSPVLPYCRPEAARRFGDRLHKCTAEGAAQASLGLCAGCSTAFVSRVLVRSGSGTGTPFGTWVSHPSPQAPHASPAAPRQ